MRFACLTVLAALAFPADAGASECPFFQPVQPPRRVQVVAHRGARGVAPENTASALECAIADGVEWVEIDVRLTRDGRHVLIHDATLDRTTDASGRVDGHTFAELKSVDAGAWFARRFTGTPIPTLGEALALAKRRVNLVLDCKEVDAARLVDEILGAGMERQVVVFAPLDVLRAVRSARGGERIALMPTYRPTDALDAFDVLKPAAIALEASDVTPERLRAFHDRGVQVQGRALGDDDRPDVWDRLVDAGADAIQTGRAEEVLAHNVLRRSSARRVLVSHHRGASRYAPENTLPAFEKAIRLGADFVEFDVRNTRDGVAFLLHDGRLDRTTTARGPIRQRDAAEVSRLDAGAWFGRPYVGTPVPSLETFLQAIGSRVELYVDAKDIAPEALVAALRAHSLIDRSVVYQHPAYLARLRAIEPRLRRMPPLEDPEQIDALAAEVAPYAFDTSWPILSKTLIDRCHERGVKVFSDALGLYERVESYQRAIRDGIDLIQTDYPVRVLRAVELIDGAE